MHSIGSLVLIWILFLGNGKSVLPNGFSMLIFSVLYFFCLKIFATTLMKEWGGQNIGYSAMADVSLLTRLLACILADKKDCLYYRFIGWCKMLYLIDGVTASQRSTNWTFKEPISSEGGWMSIGWGMVGSLCERCNLVRNKSKETMNTLAREVDFSFLLLEWPYKELFLSFWFSPF